MDSEADFILDLRGSLSPLSLLKVCRTFRDMTPDQVMEIRCTNQEQANDLRKLLPNGSFEEQTLDDGEGLTICLRVRQLGVGRSHPRCSGSTGEQSTVPHAQDPKGGKRSP